MSTVSMLSVVRLLKWVIIGLLVIGFVACQKVIDEPIKSEPTEETEINVKVTEIKYTESNKPYLAYLGQPFLIIGGQIRLDGLINRGTGAYAPPQGSPQALSYEEIEQYFVEAKRFGLNTVQVPIDWRYLEVEEDVYDFTHLDHILRMSVDHALKLEILWFSTNMVGDTHSFHLPDYIWQDEERFPRMEAFINDQFLKSYFSWMYGHVGHLVLDTPLLLEKERNVIHAMMDHIDGWNKENGYHYPVISVQVHNEADGLLRWRVDQRNLHLHGEIVSKERIWEMTLNALDNAGKAVKSSDYEIITRTNMTVSLGVSPFPQAPFASPLDVLALEGIDIVGDDPYVEDPWIISDTIRQYSVLGNYPHIAENMGHYQSTPSLMLAAYQAGGSYAIYDFATPPFFTWMNAYYQSSYQMDQGVLNDDFSDKPHSELTRRLIQGVSMSAYLFSMKDSNHIVAFNIQTRLPVLSKTETHHIDDLEIVIKTEHGALAFVILDGNDLYVYATDDVSISISGRTISPFANIGFMNQMGEFMSSDRRYPSGEFLHIEGLLLHQFRLS